MYFCLLLAFHAIGSRRLKEILDTCQLNLKELKRRQQDENMVHKISYSGSCIIPFPDPGSNSLTI